MLGALIQQGIGAGGLAGNLSAKPKAPNNGSGSASSRAGRATVGPPGVSTTNFVLQLSNF